MIVDPIRNAKRCPCSIKKSVHDFLLYKYSFVARSAENASQMINTKPNASSVEEIKKKTKRYLSNPATIREVINVSIYVLLDVRCLLPSSVIPTSFIHCVPKRYFEYHTTPRAI